MEVIYIGLAIGIICICISIWILIDKVDDLSYKRAIEGDIERGRLMSIENKLNKLLYPIKDNDMELIKLELKELVQEFNYITSEIKKKGY